MFTIKRNALVMMALMICAWPVFGGEGTNGVVAANEDNYYVLPYKPDPAIVVDGKLDDWSNVPNAITLNRKEQVTYGVNLWTGPEDLSAVVRLCWREGGLAVAAEVTDDHVTQPYTGRDIYNGDHLNLWLDLTPGVEPERTMFGAGQFHAVLSPGNFNATAGGANPIAPEIYVYRPEGLPQTDGEIVSVRTEKGYLIEAFIPWSRVGVASIKMNQDANFEVAVSEADADPAKQETLITSGEKPWVYSRLRMLPMVFGDGNGKAPAPVRGSVLQKSATLEVGKELNVDVDVPAIPEGKDPFVFFRARIAAKQVSGYRPGALAIEANAKPVEGRRLGNRAPVSTMMDGRSALQVSPAGGVSVWSTPSYDAVKKDAQYGLIDNAPACEIEFNLAGLLKPGKNTLTFRNKVQVGPTEKAQDYAILLGDVEFRIKAKLSPPPPPKPAPTGTIPFIEPQQAFPRTYGDLTQSEDRIALTVNGEPLVVTSRFSTPDDKWQTGSNAYFRHARKIVEHDEWIEVHDTFTNLTQEDVPIIQEHDCDLGRAFKSAWLGGLQMPTGNGNRSESANPSAVAATDKLCIGLLPLNDEFLVHVNQSALNGAITIRDGQFYLKPNTAYTAEWAIVPAATSDFWAFINAARRARDVNFPLKYCFAFLFHKPPIYEWSDTTLKAFIENKGVNLAVKSNEGVVNKEGKYARCTDWVAGPHDDYINLFKRIRTLCPDGKVKTGIYYDCFLDTTRTNDVKFKDDRGLDAAGNAIDYGGTGAYMHLFIPTLEKGHWGDEIAKVPDAIFNICGADGIFQDEFTRSRVDYVYGHQDGCSADIDPKTFKLLRKKGCVPLLSKDFRYTQTKRILDAGRPFIINGAPVTRTLLNLKFQAFTETGSIMNCRLMLLHSPVALGDHLTERNYADSYGVMLGALDNGCLYAWYGHIFHTNVAPTVYYYPFTPIELHSGYVIGQERIVTKLSGCFGWGDKSDFEAHVFDGDGKPTDAIKVPKIERDGKTYAEVRLPENCMAIIVRKR